MKLPPLKSLPPFIAVARHLSFSKAARELHVTHSAISQSIKLLEDFLGHPLFIRQSGKVFLTDFGKKYYDEIEPALSAIEKVTLSLLGESNGNTLTLNIGTTLTMRWLIPRLPRFQQKHPDIDLRLSTISDYVDFAKDNVDLAIAYGQPEDWPDCTVNKLFDDQLVLVGSPKLLKKKHKSIYVTSEFRKHDWQYWCDFMGVKPPAKNQRVYFQNSIQALQAAVNGIGVIVSHEPFIIDDIQSKQLIYFSKKKVPLSKSYYLVCPKRNIKNKKVMIFRKWLMKCCA